MESHLYGQVSAPKFTRRRRNPAPAIIVAVIVLIAGCWIFNMTCGGGGEKVDTSAMTEYVNRVRPIIDASTGVGQTWFSIQSSLPQQVANPDGLNDQLRVIEQQCLDLLDQARALETPKGMETTHAALLICLEQRYRAMKNYRPDLINSLTAVDVDVYAQSISEDLQEVMYSDGTYRFFKRAINEVLEENTIQEVSLPDSIWLAQWEIATLESVKSFLVTLKGTELHGLALGAVVLNPEGSIDEENGEDIHRLPQTEEMSVGVNIENQGNREEKNVVVTVSLYTQSDLTPSRQEQTIETIAPGESVLIEFSGLRPTPGGVRNILEIQVSPVPQEAFIDNNQKLIYFTVG